jgi:hypothetical protein
MWQPSVKLQKRIKTNIVRSPVRQIRKTEPENRITVKLVVNKLWFLDRFGVLLDFALVEVDFLAVKAASGVVVD